MGWTLNVILTLNGGSRYAHSFQTTDPSLDQIINTKAPPPGTSWTQWALVGRRVHISVATLRRWCSQRRSPRLDAGWVGPRQGVIINSPLSLLFVMQIHRRSTLSDARRPRPVIGDSGQLRETAMRGSYAWETAMRGGCEKPWTLLWLMSSDW